MSVNDEDSMMQKESERKIEILEMVISLFLKIHRDLLMGSSYAQSLDVKNISLNVETW